MLLLALRADIQENQTAAARQVLDILRRATADKADLLNERLLQVVKDALTQLFQSALFVRFLVDAAQIQTTQFTQQQVVVVKLHTKLGGNLLLSRGTAEQLYLSMRLALVREYANHVDPLPVVFDDIFVNFDPERSRTSFKAIRDLCSTHQVLLFTCHPHLIGQVEEIVPDAKLFAIY